MTVEQVATRSRTRYRGLRPYLLIVLVALPLLLWNLDSHPVPWFDEGFTTHAARTLAERGVYGTYNAQDGYVYFDSSVSTGPTLVLPIALSFKLLGYGMWQARLASVGFTLLMLLSLFALMKRLHGERVGLLSVMILLGWPNFAGAGFLHVARQVLGEAPTLAFMAMGWWVLFKSWSARSTWLAALAGLLFGLGMVTKTQVAIVFLPALGLISLLRLPKDYKHLVRWAMPVMVTLAVLAVWRGVEVVGQLGASPAVQAANADGYVKSIELLLLPFNFGSLLKRADWVLVAMMLTGGLASLWRARIWQLLRPSPSQLFGESDRPYEEAALGIFSVLYALWYGFISIGWSRYAFVGYVIGILLCTQLARDVLGWVFASLPAPLKVERPTALTHKLGAMLAAGLLVAASVNLLTLRTDYSAQLTANFIRTQVPRSAIIETWEWELDAISDHWEIHHPSEADAFEAIHQIFYEKKKPQLNYDALQADPDYLIVGTMSDFFGAYDKETLNEHFMLLTEFGSYRVYQRVRSRDS